MKYLVLIVLVLVVIFLFIVLSIYIYVSSLSFHETLKLLYYLEYGDED